MIETPVGCAMKLDDGSLSVIVSPHWKDPLVLLFVGEKRRFSWPKQINAVHPAYSASERVEFEIITSGEEEDFARWSERLTTNHTPASAPASRLTAEGERMNAARATCR